MTGPYAVYASPVCQTCMINKRSPLLRCQTFRKCCGNTLVRRGYVFRGVFSGLPRGEGACVHPQLTQSISMVTKC